MLPREKRLAVNKLEMLPRKKHLAVIELKILPRVIRLAVKFAYALASMLAAGPLIIA